MPLEHLRHGGVQLTAAVRIQMGDTTITTKKQQFFDDQTEEFLRKSKLHAEDRLKELERESSMRRSSLYRSEISLPQHISPMLVQSLESSPTNPNTAASQIINNFGELPSSAVPKEVLLSHRRKPRLSSNSQR